MKRDSGQWTAVSQPAGDIGLALPEDVPGSVRWALDELAEVLKLSNVGLAFGPSDRKIGDLEIRPDPRSAHDAFRFENTGTGLAIVGDARGLTYGVLELVDRIECGADPLETVLHSPNEDNHPHAPLRGIVRYFTNRKLDYRWFADQDFWPGYLTELVKHRFGRFSLAFGLGQDYGHDHGVTDNYLSFVYPFLVEVPGFSVTARGVNNAERKRNLAALRHIAVESSKRGLRFNLALWAQNYSFPDSPDLTHPIEGLTDENWPAYSGKALRYLLEQVPEITGLSLRIHYEGGVPDDHRHRFWSTVLSELGQLNRTIEIDIHSKGADAATIDLFLASGMPLTVCTKFGGEHLPLPYHEASIRYQERRPAETGGDKAVTLGARMFTRYSYGDFMKRERNYAIATRVWNGTQRFLLWADPAFASAMGREATFDGTAGLEIFDPLSLRGRWGTANDAPRTGYRDLTLEPTYDWQKYRQFYRVWGRGQYGDPNLHQAYARYLDYAFGSQGGALGEALASASRILPLVMSAHAAGGGNRDYWPELYHDVPYVDGPDHTGKPTRTGTVSPLDPEMFYGISEYVAAEMSNSVDARYRPTEVAEWFDALATDVERNTGKDLSGLGPEERRLITDAQIQALLGRFFAEKFRAALYYERFRASAERSDIARAADHAEAAAAHWRALAVLGAATYVEDIGFGRPEHLSGSWSTRLDRVTANAAALRELARNGKPGRPPPFLPARKFADEPEYEVTSADHYIVGHPFEISIKGSRIEAAFLHVRPVDHSAEFTRITLEESVSGFSATLEPRLTSGEFDLIYFFSLRVGSVWWHVPSLGRDLSKRPYLLARGRPAKHQHQQ